MVFDDPYIPKRAAVRGSAKYAAKPRHASAATAKRRFYRPRHRRSGVMRAAKPRHMTDKRHHAKRGLRFN